MAIVFISNNSNIPRAETITVTESDHELGKRDSMQSWISSGESINDWNRLTSLIYVTDKTKAELDYLLDPLISFVTIEPEVLNPRKWYWSEPEIESPFYQSMLNTGEIHTVWANASPYLLERT